MNAVDLQTSNVHTQSSCLGHTPTPAGPHHALSRSPSSQWPREPPSIWSLRWRTWFVVVDTVPPSREQRFLGPRPTGSPDPALRCRLGGIESLRRLRISRQKWAWGGSEQVDGRGQGAARLHGGFCATASRRMDSEQHKYYCYIYTNARSNGTHSLWAVPRIARRIPPVTLHWGKNKASKHDSDFSPVWLRDVMAYD